MKRGLTGRYETSQIAEETIRAFVPYPLQPKPLLRLTKQQFIPEHTKRKNRNDMINSAITPAFKPIKSLLWQKMRKQNNLQQQTEFTINNNSEELGYGE